MPQVRAGEIGAIFPLMKDLWKGMVKNESEYNS